jgi:FtsP/CotA-like multicopper oxidase with cupredoxin domain
VISVPGFLPLLLVLPLSGLNGRNVPSDPPRAAINANRRPVGTLQDGVLTIRLEIGWARWFPEADNGPSLVVAAFAERGRAPQIPGPMIRVPEGTVIHATIKNTLTKPVIIHGLHTRPGTPDDTVHIAVGAERELRFAAGAPGTYYYRTRIANEPPAVWGQLAGAFIVDPRDKPHATSDRVFAITEWIDSVDRAGFPTPSARIVLVINGKSWPHTERFTYTQGDTIRWRWVNITPIGHPMHLHGFYFRVDSRGSGDADTIYAPPFRRLVNTELMPSGSTMAIEWVPRKPGNWIFHCHFAFHVSGDRAIAPHHAAHHRGHEIHQMAGLVLGLHVRPRRDYRETAATTQPRQIRLLLQNAPRRFGDKPAFGFAIHESSAEPRAEALQIPGPLLVLRRGEPIRITVVNRLAQLSAVHWHGIELESFPDGVPGWSGAPGKIFDPIPPGDSFVAAFTPPRAGTFIYHSHSNEQLQINSGMYGALIVTDDEHPFDPSVDKLIIAGGGGPGPAHTRAPLWVNGTATPPLLNLVLGTRYRLRLINIHPDWRIEFALVTDTSFARWRPIAKDGADLPAAQATERPATISTGPGETADFEFTPTSVEFLRLEVKTFLPGWHVPVNIRIRAPRPAMSVR